MSGIPLSDNYIDANTIATDIQLGDGDNVIAKIHLAQQIRVMNELLSRLANLDAVGFSQVKAAFDRAIKNALSPEEAEAVAQIFNQAAKQRDEISRIKQYKHHVEFWD
jgi:hypothetical protein